ncbi:MAG: ABC transporter permease [Bdellovibrionales bacterium]|nr:ABC transporter permease [Bdellovibrionales bacterium]
MTALHIFFADLFSFPSWGRGVWAVWLRNFLYFRHTLLISVFWVMFEPLLYLIAIGYGVGYFVGQIDGVPYSKFFFPALMATSGMFVAFFEGSYGGYTKLARQKTYDTILLAPIDPAEIILGEILWAASKGFFSVVAVALVGAVQGMIDTILIIPALLVLAILCWVFSAFGILMASYARNYDWFVYAQSGFIIPMSLFSGTYFPLNHLPQVIQQAAYLLPLTHAVMASRALLQDNVGSLLFLNVGVLFALGFLFSNWATARMSRRIYY